MLISTILEPYEICKKMYDTEYCRQKATDTASTAIRAFLQSYDTCLKIQPAEQCRKLFPDVRINSIAIPLAAGLIIGIILGRTS